MAKLRAGARVLAEAGIFGPGDADTEICTFRHVSHGYMSYIRYAVTEICTFRHVSHRCMRYVRYAETDICTLKCEPPLHKLHTLHVCQVSHHWMPCGRKAPRSP